MHEHWHEEEEDEEQAVQPVSAASPFPPQHMCTYVQLKPTTSIHASTWNKVLTIRGLQWYKTKELLTLVEFLSHNFLDR